jgi:hypothetical protein
METCKWSYLYYTYVWLYFTHLVRIFWFIFSRFPKTTLHSFSKFLYFWKNSSRIFLLEDTKTLYVGIVCLYCYNLTFSFFRFQGNPGSPNVLEWTWVLTLRIKEVGTNPVVALVKIPPIWQPLPSTWAHFSPPTTGPGSMPRVETIVPPRLTTGTPCLLVAITISKCTRPTHPVHRTVSSILS